jgi:NADPH-dependent 2,4-dienoyl-CoA reductase/sulfur reductase-like enzyme/rhodanese-related sulfurtransferase
MLNEIMQREKGRNSVKEPTRIVVIGGVACGPKAASRARRCDPQAKITIIEQGELISYAGCGLTYYISGLVEGRNTLLARTPQDFKRVMDINVLTRTQVLDINRDSHQVETLNLKTGQRVAIDYDKLVLATGAMPIIPPLEGRNLRGVFTLKTIQDADAILSFVASQKVQKAAIVGAGPIGIEAAEAFVGLGLNVIVVDVLDWVLPTLLDAEVAAFLTRHLEQKGVDILLGQKVIAFEGDKDGRVRSIATEKARLEADLVLLAIGVQPNVNLAQDAGLAIGATGAIYVNEYLETSDPDIYAGGDCVENTSLLTGSKVYAPMGSIANKHGRIIGTNVTGGRDRFPGVLGTFMLKAFDYNVGRVGLTENEARKAGFQVVTALVPSPDHAHYYPGSEEILIKLVANSSTHRILGGQVVGPGEAAKRNDVLATALAFGCKAETLANLDLSYAPPYDSAMDPLHHAANVILNKCSGLAKALSPAEVKAKMDRDEHFIFLDVREPSEWQEWRIEAPQVRLVPQSVLRERLDDLPKDKEIVTLCRRSVRAYQAQRTLEGVGFKDVKFVDGSLTAWPYETVGNGDKST